MYAPDFILAIVSASIAEKYLTTSFQLETVVVKHLILMQADLKKQCVKQMRNMEAGILLQAHHFKTSLEINNTRIKVELREIVI